MSEEKTQEKADKPEFSAEDYANLQKENEAMRNKMQELLDETKKAKATRREAEEAARLAEEEKARKAGDFEQLHASSEKERQKLMDELTGLKSSIANEKRSTEAMRIAGSLADGANAEILSRFIADRLKFVDGELRVTDTNGNLTVSSLDDLVSEIKTSGKYNSLLKGNQASGGGATGGSAKADIKQISRQEFASLNPGKQMEFVKSGGTIAD